MADVDSAHPAERGSMSPGGVLDDAAVAELRRREALYRTLFEAIDEGFCVIQVLFEGEEPVDYRFLEVNAAFVGLTDLPDPEGKRMRELKPEHEEHWFQTYGRVARTRQPVRFIDEARHLGSRWYDVFAFPTGPPEDNKVAVVFRDITSQRRVDQALRESEARQTFLLELSDALRPKSDPGEVEATAIRILGDRLHSDRAFYVEIDEVRGILRIRHDYVRDGVSSLVGRYRLTDLSWVVPVARGGRAICVADVRTSPLIPDHQRAPLQKIEIGSIVAMPLLRQDRLVAALCVTDVDTREWKPSEVELVRDTAERTWAAAERARAESALRASEAALREVTETLEQRVERETRRGKELSETLVVAEQRERRRLSQLLHDDVQQLLYAIQMKVALARECMVEDQMVAALDHHEATLRLLDQAIARTRQLTVDLSPPVLEGEGLVEAIGWLKTHMRDLHDLEVLITSSGDIEVDPADLRILLFQIVRELLLNVAKHAETDSVQVDVSRTNGDLRISVLDRGKGFDVAMLDGYVGRRGGFSLTRARERLRMRGGELSVRSGPGRGTRVLLRAPLGVGEGEQRS